ncbi:hypothetical protein T492DRAFT_1086167 [Pavlovales sp. CCMP2436]|nr:hypothetical protein T492DRAFT_1086167 [Pavlovales sp. CCMP2436]
MDPAADHAQDAQLPEALGWAILALTLVVMTIVATRLMVHALRAARARGEGRLKDGSGAGARLEVSSKEADSGEEASCDETVADGQLSGEWAKRTFPGQPAGQTQPLASAEELKAVRAIRHAARCELTAVRSPEVSSDVRILRFLRGYPAVSEALQAYRQMLAWRHEHCMDDVCDAVRGKPLEMGALPNGELLARCYPATLLVGRTRDGHLVSRDEIGQVDAAYLFRSVGEAKTVTFFLHFLELRANLLDSESEASGQLIQAMQVKDLRGLSLSQVRSADGRRGLALVRRVLTLAVKYYPESALTLWVIGSPPFFMLIWRAISTVLPARTLLKFRILGTNFYPELAKSLEPELLDAMGYYGNSAAP